MTEATAADRPGMVPRRPEGSKPVRPRHAASLVLVRRDGDDTAVLMGRRHGRHRFMPDVFVFPGGRLDPADRAATAVGQLPGTAAAGGGSPAMLRALALAAVRETFEETGLALGAPHTVVPAAPSAAWAAFYATGLSPALDRLTYAYRAITPPLAAMRFHARFFLADAALASGRLGGSGELLDLAWYPLPAALALPIADVTENLLRDLPHLLAAPRRPVPLFCYRRGRATVLGGTLRGEPV
jgi:8-oxo-dGTP pyrophosphatase MutT (NUDIX family)